MRIELLTIFFGEKYLDLLFKTLLPSLWKSDNIPAMLKEGHEVVHHISCPPIEAEHLEIYQKCSEIPVEIETKLIPQADPPPKFEGEPSPRHAALALPVQQSIQRGNLVVIAPCDHIFGNGLWLAIKDLKPGEYMVCGHPRVDLERGFEPMQQFLKSNHDTDNRKLVSFCMNTIPHPMVEHGKRTNEPYWHCRDRGGRYEAHSSEPPPLAFWGTPDMLEPWSQPTLFGPWEVIDHELVGWTFDRHRLRWIEDSRIFFWAEFTPSRKYNPAIDGGLFCSFKYGSMRHLQQLPLNWYYG